MKKLIYSIIICTLCVVFASCSDDDGCSEKFAVVASDVTFDASESEGTITVNVAGVKAECDVDWCSLVVNDKTITVTVTANDAIGSRNTAVKLIALGSEIIVPVMQSGLRFEASAADIVLSRTGNVMSMYVEVNGTPAISSSEDWLTVSVGGDSLFFSATENIDTARIAYAIVDLTWKKDTVAVYQEGVELTLSESELTISRTVQSSSITVVSNVNFTAESDVEWATPSISGKKLTIVTTVNPNSEKRVATITLKAGNVEKKFVLTQEGILLSVSSASVLFMMNGGRDTLTVNCEMKTEITVEDSWITYELQNDTMLIISVPANPEHEIRAGNITVAAKGTAVVRNVFVAQAQLVTYEDFLGTWTISGTAATDASVTTTYTLTVTENVAGESYLVSGYGASGAGDEWPFVMNYYDDEKMPFIYIQGTQTLGTYASYTAMLTGMVEVSADSYIPISGDYRIMSGALVGNKVEWKMGDVKLSNGNTYPFVGLQYNLYSDSECASFTSDAPFPLNPIMKKSLATASLKAVKDVNGEMIHTKAAIAVK